MHMIPIATFTAGALLSLLLPVLLLIALVVWYLLFLRRVPEPSDGSQAAASGPSATPGPPPTTGV
jgi:hypothetical protein